MTDQEKVPEAAALDVIAEEKALAKKESNKRALEALYADMDSIEALLAAGDVGKIATNTALRKAFIITRCTRLGIPIHPEAVIFIPSDGKLKVYHTAVCASLIRDSRGWTSKKLEDESADGLYTVWVRVYDPKAPEHYADNVGVLPMVDGEGVPLKPSERASNKLKAFTKAERRATFSLAGLAGEDPREDGGLQGYYPDEGPTQELKVIEPKARLVSAAKAPVEVLQPAAVQTPGEAPLELTPTPAEAPKKRRVVKRKDGTVVPQPQPQGVEPAETSTRMPIPASTASPSASPANAAPVAGVEGPAAEPVAQEAPQEAPCAHPGMVRWLASAPRGKTHPCPDCEEVLVAPGPPAQPVLVSEGMVLGSNTCLHPALKNGKPGRVYCCPPPPEGCGQEVRIPGEPEPIKVATTPMPVRPRAVRIVKRVTPR